jgi:membrane protein
MDTAFGRIYHVESRSWLSQKRFSLIMLLVVALFLAASVVIPTLEGAVVSTTTNLPLGLSNTRAPAKIVLIAGALATTFVVACVIYWATPKGHMPWRSVWPGALLFTGFMGIVNFAYPFYLGNISNLSQVGGTIGFVLIALLWFYVISLALLVGAVINSLRHEKHDTGRLPLEG